MTTKSVQEINIKLIQGVVISNVVVTINDFIYNVPLIGSVNLVSKQREPVTSLTAIDIQRVIQQALTHYREK